MKTTREKIDIMEAWERGEKIEYRFLDSINWFSLNDFYRQGGTPNFNWSIYEYRIAKEPEIPDSIDWSHVSQEYRWLARDEDGSVYLYDNKPQPIEGRTWFGGLDVETARPFASYRQGNLPWDKSLVQRPEGV